MPATPLTDDVRLVRASRQPALGREAARALLAENPQPTTWEPLGGGVARDGVPDSVGHPLVAEGSV